MRHILTFLATSLFIVVLHGQAKFSIKEQPICRRQIETPPNHSSIKSLKPHEYFKRKASAFWTEDFSNGFFGQGNNGSWSQLSTTNPTTGNTPKWEYRGPNTTPDNSVGTRGSCAGSRGPIKSSSAANGFVIFDSNYWDEPGPDSCAGLGTGLAPRPHNASIISPSIDLSSHPSVELFFTTYARNFQAELNLYAIADGDTLFITEVYDHIRLAQNIGTSYDRLVRIDISEFVGSKPDIKLLWNFVGDYYFFSMDDIYLSAIPEYDYEIVEVWNDNINNTFEYYDLPLSQSHKLSPGLRIKSGGSQPVDLDLVINILDPNGVLHGPYTKTLNSMQRDSISPPIFIPTIKPELYGEYHIQYQVKSDFDSNNIEKENNTATRTINISKNFWSDASSDSVIFYPTPIINGKAEEIEVFQLYQTFNEAQISGAQFVIMNSESYPNQKTKINDTIQLSVYELDKSAFSQTQYPWFELYKTEHFELIDSSRIIVTAEMLSTTDIAINSFLFEKPIPLESDQIYAIGLYNVNGYINLSLTSPRLNTDGSGLIRSDAMKQDPLPVGNNEVHQFNNFNPWLKAIMYHEESLPSIGDPLSSLNTFPNPATRTVTVAYTLKNNTNVGLTLTDLSGKVIATQNEGPKNAGVNKLTFDVSSLDAGVYFYSVSINGATATKKLVVY